MPRETWWNCGPVLFIYKNDSSNTPQYGLIAEEVAEVYPELVVHSADGQIETVRYHLLSSMLLNELQKQHKKMEKQERIMEMQNLELNDMKTRMSQLESAMQKLMASNSVKPENSKVAKAQRIKGTEAQSEKVTK